jgi:MYXO-CTERM domain-containing protein
MAARIVQPRLHNSAQDRRSSKILAAGTPPVACMPLAVRRGVVPCRPSVAVALSLGLAHFASGCGGAPDEPQELVDSLAQRVGAPLGQAHCSIKVSGIGTIDMEQDYLPHVIQCENGGADLQALKAQAIAARSVAYYNIETQGSICDGQGCQVYSCGASPKAIHHQAVLETAGQYLAYDGMLTYGFYVAGDSSVSPPGCVGSSGSTEHYVTYNEGRSGTSVEQTSLGWIGPPGYGQNRGCMGQWGARCLESKGYDYLGILRFYYGDDIGIATAPGSCVGCDAHCEGSVMVGSDCGQGDCAAYGASCVDDSLGVRCVNPLCPVQGAAKVCTDDSTIMDCQDGNSTGTGDCSAYGAWCSTAHGGEPRCVSVFCVAGPSEAPIEHDVCLPDGRLAHCTAQGGLENPVDCPPLQPCVADAGGARCGAGSAGGAGTGGGGEPGAGGSAAGASGSGGTGWGAAGAAASGAVAGEAGEAGAPGGSVQASRVLDDADGCACRSAGHDGGPAPRPAALLLAGAFGLAARRKRR